MALAALRIRRRDAAAHANSAAACSACRASAGRGATGRPGRARHRRHAQGDRDVVRRVLLRHRQPDGHRSHPRLPGAVRPGRADRHRHSRARRPASCRRRMEEAQLSGARNCRPGIPATRSASASARATCRRRRCSSRISPRRSRRAASASSRGWCGRCAMCKTGQVRELPPSALPPAKTSDPAAWDVAIGGMIDVANAPYGTARGAAANAPYLIAGKSGTAQVFTAAANERVRKAERTRRTSARSRAVHRLRAGGCADAEARRRRRGRECTRRRLGVRGADRATHPRCLSADAGTIGGTGSEAQAGCQHSRRDACHRRTGRAN